MYIDTATNRYPVSESQIRAEYQNTSFPFPFVPPEKFANVFDTPVPEHNPLTHYYIESTPVLTEKGIWEKRWEIAPKFQEYTDENGVVHTVAEQEAAAIAADQQQKLEELKRTVVNVVQKRLDDFAKTRNYDGILSAATYATSSVPKFQQEGQYAVEARDLTWAKLYEILAEVEAGTRPAPTSYADIEPELPVLAWPV